MLKKNYHCCGTNQYNPKRTNKNEFIDRQKKYEFFVYLELLNRMYFKFQLLFAEIK